MIEKKSALTIALAGLVFAAAAAPAAADPYAPWTPRVDARQENQQRRIYNGVQDGSLTPAETRGLVRGQVRVERRERYFKSDGVVTPGERRSLNRLQNRQSRRIFRRKNLR